MVPLSLSSANGSIMWQKRLNGSESSITEEKGIQKEEQAYQQDIEEL